MIGFKVNDSNDHYESSMLSSQRKVRIFGSKTNNCIEEMTSVV